MSIDYCCDRIIASFVVIKKKNFKNECERDSFCDIDVGSAIINKQALAIVQSGRLLLCMSTFWLISHTILSVTTLRNICLQFTACY